MRIPMRAFWSVELLLRKSSSTRKRLQHFCHQSPYLCLAPLPRSSFPCTRSQRKEDLTFLQSIHLIFCEQRKPFPLFPQTYPTISVHFVIKIWKIALKRKYLLLIFLILSLNLPVITQQLAGLGYLCLGLHFFHLFEENSFVRDF